MDNRAFLFPLTGAVLFKKVTLPFHIFEERYRVMIRDSINMQIPVAVVSYNQFGYYGEQTCVAGIPHILTTYPDGRMDIYITGTIKCVLKEFESEDPYKIYTYQVQEEDLEVDDSFEIELESLRSLLKRWSIHFLPDPSQREAFARTLEDPELLVNYCAVFLVDDLVSKKEIMEANSIREKIKILLHLIGPKEISLGPFMPNLKF